MEWPGDRGVGLRRSSEYGARGSACWLENLIFEEQIDEVLRGSRNWATSGKRIDFFANYSVDHSQDEGRYGVPSEADHGRSVPGSWK